MPNPPFLQINHGAKNILALHGWGSSASSFAPLKAHLPSSYSLLCPEFSVPPLSQAQTLQEASRLLQAFLKNFSKPVIGLANCSGAFYLLDLAQKEQALFSHLFLLDPFAYAPWYFKIFTKGQLGRHAFSLTFHSQAFGSLINRFLNTKQSSSKNYLDSQVNFSQDDLINQLNLFISQGHVSRFQGPTLPITLILGEHTFSAVKNSVKLWQTVFPNLQVIILPKVGHLQLQEAPEKIVSIITQ